jgi:uncharacterized protein (AIM24 family)
MNSELFASTNVAGPPTGPGMTLQNSKSIRYVLEGECYARQGSMIAFRGDVQFEKQSQGVGNFLKRGITGEGLALMACRGRGEVWFAHEAGNCFILDFAPGDSMSLNGRNILCFDRTLAYDIKIIKGAGMIGGGLTNSVFTGTGRLGLVCEGEPIVIPVYPQLPVYVDTDAVVGWSASLQTTINRSQSVGSMLRGGSGEVMQLKLEGDGFVVVRPSELKTAAPAN